MKDTKRNLNKKIKLYRVISFDVYDTLIRRIIEPSKLYLLIENKLISDGCTYARNFSQNRIEAEKNLWVQKNTSYSLSDIYKTKVFEYLTENERSNLIKMEEEWEIRNTISTEIGMQLYKECIEQNKHIICISDMYLGKRVITEILNKNGYRINEVYVSCDYKKSKRNGNLFEEVVENIKTNKKHILHIGDALRSDFLNPRMIGIDSYHVDTSKRVYSQNYYYRLGLETIGPIIYEFNCWLKEQSSGNGLLFLAREGEILAKFYREQFHEDTHILYVSRKAVLRGVAACNSISELMETIKVDRFETVADVFEWLGIDIEPYKTELMQRGISSTSKITDEFYNYFDETNLLESACKENYKLFSEYMEENFVHGAILVDIGWWGSMQKLLQDYIFSNYNTRIKGLYLGVLDTDNKKGFLFEGVNKYSNDYRCFSGLLEILLMPGYGSVIGYKNIDGHVKPIFDKSEFSIESLDIINEIQRGGVDLIKNLNFIDGVSCFDLETCKEKLVEFGCSPSKRDIEALSKLEFYDNSKKYRLVSDISFKNIIKPKELVRQFAECRWKTAFCQKLFGFRFPYNKLIYGLRNIV